MQIAIELDDEYLRSVISGAGSRYWASDFEWTHDLNDVRARIGFALTERDEQGQPRHVVTEDMLHAGLVKMARDESGHFADLVSNTTDMWTGDAVIQYAIFGELKYG